MKKTGLLTMMGLMAMQSNSLAVPSIYENAPKRSGGKRALSIKEFKPNKARRSKYKKRRNRAGK